MTTAIPRLEAVPPPSTDTDNCAVACKVTLRGRQQTTVRVLAPVTGAGPPLIGVRVGFVLLLVSDRHALRSVVEACRRAAHLADAAFGPDG